MAAVVSAVGSLCTMKKAKSSRSELMGSREAGIPGPRHGPCPEASTLRCFPCAIHNRRGYLLVSIGTTLRVEDINVHSTAIDVLRSASGSTGLQARKSMKRDPRVLSAHSRR